jgi:DNA-binding NtrC family response regulator
MTLIKPQILIIEDDDLQYEIYEEALAEYSLVRACSGREALAAISKSLPNLILLDHILAEGELGLDYLPELKELLPHVPVLIVSGALEVQQQINALQGPRRAHYCIAKPWTSMNSSRRSKPLCRSAERWRSYVVLKRWNVPGGLMSKTC